MNLTTLKKGLKEIRDNGFIKTLRAGDTGVGHTFEQMLGLRESNISIPDLGGKIELKVQRKTTSNRITLFTKSPEWIVYPKEIIKTYGYINGDDRSALKITFSTKKPVSGLSLKINNITDKIEIINGKGKTVAYWETSELRKLFNRKFPKLIIIKASSRGLKRKEEFLYEEAYILKGVSEEGLMNTLLNGYMVIEFRMHLRSNGSVRDHGTAFRIAENKLETLFRKRIKFI